MNDAYRVCPVSGTDNILKSEQCIVNVGFVELAQFCCHLVDDVKTEP